MKKLYDLSTRKTAAAITKINNCLPIFPLGSPASEFTDQEVVGLLKWSLPSTWRKKFDLDGCVPTLGTKAKLILECEAIERNENVNKKERKDDDHNNNNYKKNKFGNSAARAKKNERGGNGQFYCKNCGLNHTHVTAKCYSLNNKTWQTQRLDKKNLTTDKEASKKNHPFLRCTFRKEVNTLARKSGKKRVLGLYAAALKRKQDKESKAKVAKRCAIKAEDSLSSEVSISVNNWEKAIPRKKEQKFRVAKAVPKVKSNKKADKKKDNEEMDIGFLSAVKKMQIEDEYDMLDSDDDVLSLDDDEISITSADV
jgi:hypothetical protein